MEREVLAAAVLRALEQGCPGSRAELRGSLAAGTGGAMWGAWWTRPYGWSRGNAPWAPA
ncbi:hypothetical protein [Streptomyces sp. NPDC050738]|uniref:hypothetical protein n=1 Tax=Streptomyces sp. NPDC050738 TaxID=3154744 RepID=UPI0034252323